MQQGFRPMVREALALYQDLYGPTLVSVYVMGSVARDEAIPGRSDLDMGAFVSTPLPRDARQAFEDAERRRLARFAHAGDGVGRPRVLGESLAAGQSGLSPRELVRDALRYVLEPQASGPSGGICQARARYVTLAFALRYEVEGVYGPAPASLLACRPQPEPDALFARFFLHTPLETVRLAAQGSWHPEFSLPASPEGRLRKLGRLAVLLCAGLLMARAEFRSLRGRDVLPGAEQVVPGWSPFLHDTARLYHRVQPGAPDESQYLPTLVAFAAWVEQEVTAGPKAEDRDG